MNIASRYDLPVIEDCAQAYGANINGQAVGTFGRLGTVSFHPLKNLGTLGDGGIILAQRDEDLGWLKLARNHGQQEFVMSVTSGALTPVSTNCTRLFEYHA